MVLGQPLSSLYIMGRLRATWPQCQLSFPRSRVPGHGTLKPVNSTKAMALNHPLAAGVPPLPGRTGGLQALGTQLVSEKPVGARGQPAPPQVNVSGGTAVLDPGRRQSSGSGVQPCTEVRERLPGKRGRALPSLGPAAHHTHSTSPGQHL